MVEAVAGSSLAVLCAEDAGKLTWWEVGGGKGVKEVWLEKRERRLEVTSSREGCLASLGKRSRCVCRQAAGAGLQPEPCASPALASPRCIPP